MASAALCWFLFADLPLWFYWFPRVPDLDDFTLYFAAAQIGLQHGWAHIYDQHLQAVQFSRLHAAGQTFDWRSFYITPPPMAWLVVPLTSLPHAVAYYLWAGLLLCAYLGVGLAAAPGPAAAKLSVVLFGLTTFPVLSNLRFGNAALLVTAAMVGSWLCIRRGRPYWAGLLLAGLFLKPQTAYLVPLALLVWGEWRPLLVTGPMLFLLALGSIASLGPAGVADWRNLSAQEPAHLQNQLWTAAILVGPGVQAPIVEAAVAGIALLIAWLSRGRGPEPAISASLAGSLLAAPYHNASDAVVLLAALWVYLHTSRPAWHRAWLAFGAASALLVPPLGARPLMLFAAGWLLIMLWEAAIRAGRVSENACRSAPPSAPA